MGVSRSDECAERVMAIVRPRYLVKLAVAGAVSTAAVLIGCHAQRNGPIESNGEI